MAITPVPAQSTDLSNLIERVIADLPPSLYSVAKYALAQGHNLAVLSVDDIAAECQVSKATVVRFCRALGFDGLRSFKQSIITGRIKAAESSATQATKLQQRSGSVLNPQTMLQAVADSVLAGIRLTDPKMFAAAARQVAGSSLVVWYGVGDSSNLAASGHHRCQINRFNSRAIHIPEDLQAVAHQLTAADALICISRSGRTSSIVNPLRVVRSTSAVPIISVIGDPGSPLAQMSDYNLVSAPVDVYVDQQRTTMQTAQMSMIDALISAVLQLRYQILRCTGAGNLHLTLDE